MAARITTTDIDVDKDTATLIAADDAQRRILYVSNNGANHLYIGPSDVTAATGFKVPKVDANGVPGVFGPIYYSVGDQSVCLAWYAITETADQSGTANTRVLETFAA